MQSLLRFCWSQAPWCVLQTLQQQMLAWNMHSKACSPYLNHVLNWQKQHRCLALMLHWCPLMCTFSPVQKKPLGKTPETGADHWSVQDPMGPAGLLTIPYHDKLGKSCVSRFMQWCYMYLMIMCVYIYTLHMCVCVCISYYMMVSLVFRKIVVVHIHTNLFFFGEPFPKTGRTFDLISRRRRQPTKATENNPTNRHRTNQYRFRL